MGGAVSSGENNDELVDNLMDAQYIKTPLVEKIFRSVDRAFYYTKSNRQSPYKDLAWKHGNLHLSAPCIYSEVLENLQLEAGMSFLNIGSGTGYLSTMVGLILGKWGINHGIELHEDVVEYARFKLDRFKKSSHAVDLFELCEPSFVVGNVMDALPSPFKYDRIYCGAACSRTHLPMITDTLKVGGVAVVPVDDSLIQIKRVSVSGFEEKELLSVSFATLVESRTQAPHSIPLPEWNALTLAEICRGVIRDRIRKKCRTTVTEQNNGRAVSKAKKRNSRIAGACTFGRINGTSETLPGSGIVSILPMQNSGGGNGRTEEGGSSRQGRNDEPSSTNVNGGSNNARSNDGNEEMNDKPSTSRRYERPHPSENESSDADRTLPVSSDEEVEETAKRLRTKNCCGRKRSIRQTRDAPAAAGGSGGPVSAGRMMVQELIRRADQRRADSSSDNQDGEPATSRRSVHFQDRAEDLEKREDSAKAEKRRERKRREKSDEEYYSEEAMMDDDDGVKEKKKNAGSSSSSRPVDSDSKNSSSQRQEVPSDPADAHKDDENASPVEDSVSEEYSSDEEQVALERRIHQRFLHPVARLLRLNVPADGEHSDSGDSIADPEPRMMVVPMGGTRTQSFDLSEEYVDEPLPEINHPLTVAMREKIMQLPLPMILKLYLNYQRSL